MRNNYTGPHARSLASEGSVTRGRLGGEGYAGNILHGFKGTAAIRFPSGERWYFIRRKKGAVTRTHVTCCAGREYEGIVYLRIRGVHSRRFHFVIARIKTLCAQKLGLKGRGNGFNAMKLFHVRQFQFHFIITFFLLKLNADNL